MQDIVLRLPGTGTSTPECELLWTREWLVTNGLGGYASGTLVGVLTRRYHGLLIAALPVPLGRTMMLNNLAELLCLPDGRTVRLGAEERVGALDWHGAGYLSEFRLEAGLPVWRYDVDGIALEKRVLLLHRQNTVHVRYRLVASDRPVRLQLRPSVPFRTQDEPVGSRQPGDYQLTTTEDRIEIQASSPSLPRLRLWLVGDRTAFTVDGRKLHDLRYRVEESLGYDSRGDLWSPGYFDVDLASEHDATLVASTESWDSMLAVSSEEASRAERDRRSRLLSAAMPQARTGPAANLVLAADQFLITPVGRGEDAANAHTVIAGYHWFTDWGRDTMISLEGLTITTGRLTEACSILRTFAHSLCDGLIPNLYPEGAQKGLYHTADATLWFFHALDRYVAASNDRETLQLLLPRLLDVIKHHLRGTRFGIGVDPADGLLRQGADGYQLTWMDAKVGDWVVTPRRGKAVEINALWYNALRLAADWTRAELSDEAARPLAEQAERVARSFNERFWYAEGGYLYDVVDGPEGQPDPACRPNQVLAVSLQHPVLLPSRWKSVLDMVRERLLTPVGLRSLAPGHPDYKAKCCGDLRARDAAYHQGTVWAWLIGPFVDAWLKVYPNDRAGARRLLQGLMAHLDETCIGSLSEIFDAEPPFTPRGCVAQAWSVAEVLRCWVKTAE